MKFKKNLWIFITLLFIFLLTSCGTVNSTRALNLLRDKYGEGFDLIEERNTGEYIVCSKENPNVLFKINLDSNGKTFSDNYITKLVSLDLVSYIKENLSLNDGFYIYCFPTIDISLEENKDLTIKEFAEKYPENKYTVYFFYDSDLYKQTQIEKELLEINLGFLKHKVETFGVPETTLIKVEDYLKTHDTVYYDFENMVDQYRNSADVS